MEPMVFSWNEVFWSHPNIPLSQHLSKVGEACKKFLQQAGISDEKLLRLAELIGKAHDFGKYTSFFQQYIRNQKIDPELKEHSQISALFAAWLIDRELKDDFLTFIGFVVTLAHHGNLNKGFDDILRWLEENFGDVKNRFRFNPTNQLKKMLQSLLINIKRISSEMERIGISDVREFIKKGELSKIYRRLYKLIWEFKEKESIEEVWNKYFILLLLFSAFVDADRRDAAQLIKQNKREKLSSNLVDVYRKKAFKEPSSPLDLLRNKVYESTINSLDFTKLTTFKNSTITAPTGIGKTLLAFSIALKLREKIYKSTGLVPRIVYVLPYINIIEQTYDVFSEVLESTKGFTSPYLLLKHHHLYFPKREGEGIPLDEAFLLQEAWDSEIIVTTFVQFFHTLISGNKHFLRKFHNMFNSIIILDEVQTIPLEYWDLTKELLQEFTKNSNSFVIAMTATQPIIFGEESWTELVPSFKEFFEVLDRVNYYYIDKDIEINEMVNWFFSDIWNKKRPNSVLIVLNTIQSSIEAYQLIKEKFPENKIICLGEEKEKKKIKDTNRVVIAYLSTNIIPIERKRRIECIKRLLKDGRKVIVISTQVIEAGVDLDFEVAIRDIGPIASIVQVAGRCNRNSKRKGDVYIVRIIREGKKLASYIYGSLTIFISEQILARRTIFRERDILQITEKYFREEYERKSQEESRDILNAIKKLNFSTIHDKFKWIKDEPRETIFIEIDRKAEKTLKDFLEILKRLSEVRKSGNLKEFFRFKLKLREKRIELESWLINTWNQERGKLPHTVISESGLTTIWYVNKNEVNDYYDRETGYKLESHGAIL